MRTLLTVSMPAERANAAVRDGSLQVTVKHMLDVLRPEAAYFGLGNDGVRTAYIVFDLKEPSDMPAITEPLFLSFGATMTMRPVMSAEDLGRALAAMEGSREAAFSA